MVEIGITKAIPFDKGYVIETTQNLVSTTLYNLYIDDGINAINKTYINNNTNRIVDTWGAYIPQDVDVCFTLTDTACPPINCTLTII